MPLPLADKSVFFVKNLFFKWEKETREEKRGQSGKPTRFELQAASVDQNGRTCPSAFAISQRQLAEALDQVPVPFGEASKSLFAPLTLIQSHHR
jgi:hypothetical protein